MTIHCFQCGKPIDEASYVFLRLCDDCQREAIEREIKQKKENKTKKKENKG
jgi:NMD protein affecting ribosome stability and mRNA decay